MSHETATLEVEKREKLGSRYSRRLRAAGKLPAVVYGHAEGPVAITLDAKEAITHISKGEKLFTLNLDGKDEHVLLKDLGYDYLGTNIIHADLRRVSLDERVNTKAHLRIVGDSIGLKTAGTVMMNPIHELQLNCLVTNLPDDIEVDIADLDIGDMLHAKDIKLPKATMVLLTDPEAVVVQIVMSKVAEVTDEESEVTDGTEPALVDAKPADEEGESKE